MSFWKRRREEEEKEKIMRPVLEVLEQAISPEFDLHSRRRSSGSFALTSPGTPLRRSSSVPKMFHERENDVEDGPVPFEDIKASNLFSASQLILFLQHKPTSAADFMSRLDTFDITRWSNKPDCISAFHCARHGWLVCEDFDGLICVSCHQVVPFSRRSASVKGVDNSYQLRETIEKSGHLVTCLWRKQCCPFSILALPQDFEMLRFIRRGFASFAACFHVPNLDDHYESLLNELNLNWILDISEGAVMNTKVSEEEKGKLHKILHFLLLNGWSMDGADFPDGLHCNRCLRDVPLWIFSSSSLTNSKENRLDEEKAPVKNEKKFDPVANHHWWCPWRQLLEYEFSPARILPFIKDDSISVREKSNEPFLLNVRATKEDYKRLELVVQAECAKATMRKEGQSGAKLITSLVTVMDNFMGPHHAEADVGCDHVGSDVQNSEMTTVASDVQNSEMTTVASDVQNSEMTTVASDVQNSEMTTVASDVQNSEMTTVASDESECSTSELAEKEQTEQVAVISLESAPKTPMDTEEVTIRKENITSEEAMANLRRGPEFDTDNCILEESQDENVMPKCKRARIDIEAICY